MDIDRNAVVAVVGASRDRSKWGWKVYNKLLSDGFRVYPVNPKYGEIEGRRCYPDLKSLPEKPDMVITVVPPKVTERIVEECRDIGIRKVWMQPGSESQKAIEFCRRNGIEVMYNACFVVDGLKEGFE